MTTEILWLSPTDFVTGDNSLRISYPSATNPAVKIRSINPGNQKWISLGLKIPPFQEINAIHVCYQLSNSRSFISQIRLAELKTPDQALERHKDETDLLSTAPICYRSPLANSYRSGGAVLLELRLDFATPADTITLGGMGLEILACVPVPSYTKATLPKPSTPGCLARVTDNVRGLWMYHGNDWFSLNGGIANVREFGAVGDGTHDDISAFEDAIAALTSDSTLDLGKGGVILVPPGTYRFSKSLSVKKSVVIRGSNGSGGGGYAGCVIQPDKGITAIIIEQGNTQGNTYNLIWGGRGDETVVEGLTVYPNQKTPEWQPNTQYLKGNRVKVGNGNGLNWAKHYECVIGGTSANFGLGPRGFGTTLFACAAVVNNELFVIGRSAPDPGDGSIIYKYDPVANSWIPGTNPPLNGLRYMGCAVFNDKIYVFGGENKDGTIVSTVNMYDPATDTWTTKASMPTARSHLAAAVVKDKIYAIGGTRGGGDEKANFYGIVEEYDPNTDTWNPMPRKPMPTPRRELAVAVLNDKIYAIGGYSPAYENTVEEYDPDPLIDQWTTKKPMPTPRRNLATIVIDNKIYAIGGNNPASLADVEVYDPAPAIDTWTPVASMPTPRGTAGVAVGILEKNNGTTEKFLYAVGGEWSVSTYNLSTHTWTLRIPTIADDNVCWKYIGGGHGIQLRTRATLRDVSILNCSGNGIHIEAGDPDLVDAACIADGWRLDNVNLGDCEGHGYFIRGSDVTGGVAIGGTLQGNGLSAGNYAISEVVQSSLTTVIKAIAVAIFR